VGTSVGERVAKREKRQERETVGENRESGKSPLIGVPLYSKSKQGVGALTNTGDDFVSSSFDTARYQKTEIYVRKINSQTKIS